ncbi:MAG TPA: CPBP family intramembrane glutamic endopeptidase [Anaerolineae bacterium]|nr:CPBP family intramembrane glutamic endopeptidase [Anaerolineae bacterium]
MTMKSPRLSAREWSERTILALLFIVIGGVVMIVFSPWGKQRFVDPVDNYLWRAGLSLLLVVIAWLVYRSGRYEKYWQLFFALFILSVAVSLDWVFGRFLFDSLHVSDTTPAGWALPKLNELVVIGGVVILFTRLSGGSLGAIYIQKGNLKLGLIIGAITFILAAAGSIPTAELFFKGEGLTLTRVLPWTPWLLLTVLANGALEELMFRGLFLRKLEPFFGKFLSNILIAFVFTGLHRGAYYTSEEMIFLVILFPLALAWGYIMQKTDSVWGSILFHAGMDIPIFLGIFSTLS